MATSLMKFEVFEGDTCGGSFGANLLLSIISFPVNNRQET